MNKQIANMLSVNNAMHAIESPNDNHLFKFEETLATSRVKTIDEYILKQLYEAYKDTKVSKVFVIDMTEFEAFLKKMLPLWLEGKK